MRRKKREKRKSKMVRKVENVDKETGKGREEVRGLGRREEGKKRAVKKEEGSRKE